MGFIHVPKVQIDGIAACVPTNRFGYEEYKHLFTEKEYRQFQQATGIYSARMSKSGITTSDLCQEAAIHLMDDMNIDRKDIEVLVFVSQTPDYIVPMTSCILQHRLGLSEECLAFDCTAGCSGYIYGLSMLSSLLSGRGVKKGLLLVGDSGATQLSPGDKSVYPLFGSAGTASIISFDESAEGLKFHLATDGSGYEAIMIKAGGQRHPITTESLIPKAIEPGIVRSDVHLILNGMDVFSFAISEVPESIEKLYTHYGLNKETTDYFVFHQANKMILDMIADQLELPEEKVPTSLREFANTSSASIPLTLVTEVGSIHKETSFCLCGFGVGLSWGSCYFNVSQLYCSKLIEYDV